MIRHAGAPAACPVGPVPVAVIVPSLRAFLVFPLGGPNLLPARFLPAAETAVFVAPVTMTADPEHPATVRSPGKTVDAVALHGSASPRFRRDGTTATEHGQRGLNYRGWSVGSFGPSQKARWAANGRVLPYWPRRSPRAPARNPAASAGPPRLNPSLSAPIAVP